MADKNIWKPGVWVLTLFLATQGHSVNICVTNFDPPYLHWNFNDSSKIIDWIYMFWRSDLFNRHRSIENADQSRRDLGRKNHLLFRMNPILTYIFTNDKWTSNEVLLLKDGETLYMNVTFNSESQHCILAGSCL